MEDDVETGCIPLHWSTALVPD